MSPVFHHIALPVEVPDGALLVLRLDTPDAWDAPLPPDLAPRVAWLETRSPPGLEPTGGEVPPIDFVLTDPALQAPLLYRAARWARQGRSVRVTVPAAPGLLAALRVGCSLGLRVRLDLGQPAADVLDELLGSVDLYLRGPGTDAPVEPWHSALSWLLGAASPDLWEVLEDDPALHRRADDPRPASFVAAHGARLDASGAECLSCELRAFCGGHFKWPEPAYDCTGVRGVFVRIAAAAEQLRHDLAEAERLTGTGQGA